MEGLVIPTVGLYGIFVVVTIAITSLLKKIIKYKGVYPYIPIVFATIFGGIVAFFEVGFSAAYFRECLTAIFSIAAGAIASYDVVVEKIERYFNKIKESKDGVATSK